MRKTTRRPRLTAAIAQALLLIPIADSALAREEAPPSPESTAAYRQGYDAVLDRDWAGAEQAFARLMQDFPRSSWVDDAAFWRCYATMQSNADQEAAFTCFESHVRNYRDSEWQDDARRAMVRLADQLDGQGKSQYRRKVRDFGRDDDHDQLLEVLVALGEIGDERSLDVILQRLDQADDEHLRARIVDVLEEIDSPRIFDRLALIARSDPSEQVRVVAVNALGEQESLDASAILRELATDTKQPSQVRVEAMDELLDYGTNDTIELLKSLARDPDREVAEEAIDALGDIGDTASLDALAELLGSLPDADLRFEIIDEIEDFESDNAVQILLQAAKDEPDPRVRREATEALGDMEGSAAREALIELLRSVDEEGRR